VHPFAQVLVKNKPQNIIPEIIRPHFSPQGVGNVPELLFQFLLAVIRHNFQFLFVVN
jgi:hypothetical protein